MDKINVKLMQYDSLNQIVQLACMVTRGANQYSSPEELLSKIQNSPWTDERILEMLKLPHSKIARFTDFTFLITGTSRRFLAQITTHHVGISIMSGSLQYSDHSTKSLEDKFLVPYEMFKYTDVINNYLEQQEKIMKFYGDITDTGFNRDVAGYTAPQSLRNILLIKVNLEALMYIGNQRICRRNTTETEFVVGRMVEEVINETKLPFELFAPSCVTSKCGEGKFACGRVISKKQTITDVLDEDFKLIRNR